MIRSEIPLFKNTRFREFEVSDYEFLFKIRTDKKLNRYLSKISGSSSEQRKYLESYHSKEFAERRSVYFLIENALTGVPCGSVRLYNINEQSFEWGSWILTDEKHKYSAVATAVFVYEFAFNVLNLKHAIFEVNRENLSVVKFHKRSGARLTRSDEVNAYFEFSEAAALKFCDNMRKNLDL